MLFNIPVICMLPSVPPQVLGFATVPNAMVTGVGSLNTMVPDDAGYADDVQFDLVTTKLLYVPAVNPDTVIHPLVASVVKFAGPTLVAPFR